MSIIHGCCGGASRKKYSLINATINTLLVYYIIQPYTYNEILKEAVNTRPVIEILNIVIDKLGHMTKKEIVEFMHNEVAYKETAPKGIIEFRYAENLQI